LYIDRGNTHAARGDYQKGLADCDQATRLAPNFFASYNLRAWIYATCPEERYRDGKKAVESATRACELTGWRDPGILDTLAAACAEAGDFDSAVMWGKKAMGLLVKDDETNRRDFGARLELYQAKKPYRMKAEAGNASNKAKE
jgi:serine/threonine-protein kinase